MKLSFTKMHGAGNDFVVIDATRERFRPTPDLLRRLGDRRFGVGCDQILVIEAPSAPGIDFDYRIFNADGSEVGQCGNGTRALARYVYEHGLSDKPRLRVQTATATMELQRLDNGLVKVDMGAPRWQPAQIPLLLPQAERYRIDTADGALEFGAPAWAIRMRCCAWPMSMRSTSRASAAACKRAATCFRRASMSASCR